MPALTRLLLAGFCAAAAASAVQAQSRLGHVANTPPPASSQSSQAAPQPGGLRPVFPAGVTSGSGAAVSTDPVAATTAPTPPSTSPTPSPGTPTTPTGGGGRTLVPDVAVVPATNVLGAGATVRGPAQSVGGAGGFNATDVARSFFFADANHDGELTRAEAARLSILTLTFEEMDRNFDGIISRFEYEDSVR